MALANRKSEDIFNKKTGGNKDAKSIDTTKETEIKNQFDNGDHILDEGMFENFPRIRRKRKKYRPDEEKPVVK